MLRSMTLRTVFDLLVVGLLTLLVSAPSHARQAHNVPLEKIASQAVNCDLVMMVQTLELIQENPTTYDESASGKTYQYFDEESNLNYNYFRNYQPTQGRYTQGDPIGLQGGINRFTYVENNPLNDLDPLGLAGLLGNKAIDNQPLTGGGGGGALPAPNFAVSSGGTAFPIPAGARGPFPVVNPGGRVTGSSFTGGSGGANGQVCNARFMDPTPSRGSSPGYPNGYVKYENSAGQGVDPYTGRTLPNSQSHYPK